MTLNLEDCVLSGPALTAPFLRDGLVLPNETAPDWNTLRHSFREGGAERVHRHVTTKLATAFGYGRPKRQDPVSTREGAEDGGWLLKAANGASLRAWSVPGDADLDAAGRSPLSYRSSPTRIAQRVLLSRGERAGLLTNGDVLRLS